MIMGTITASMNFLTKDTRYNKERPYLLIYEPPEGFPKSNIKLENHADLQLTDLRGHEDKFSLRNDGFQITSIRSKLSGEDYDDEDLVKNIYLKEVADAVREMFGAHKVQIFEHLVRKRHVEFPISTGEPYQYNQPTSIAHVDTTREWTVDMVRRLNPATSDQLLQGRVLCVNVWKPIRGPVQDWPLCICHPDSVDPSDLHPGDLVYDDYVIENMQLHYADGQKWYYLSEQSADEAWVFIQSDSETKVFRVGVPHSAFALPASMDHVMPRESIEVRCLVYV